jgi:hypothetical protein
VPFGAAREVGVLRTILAVIVSIYSSVRDCEITTRPQVYRRATGGLEIIVKTGAKEAGQRSARSVTASG